MQLGSVSLRKLHAHASYHIIDHRIYYYALTVNSGQTLHILVAVFNRAGSVQTCKNQVICKCMQIINAREETFSLVGLEYSFRLSFRLLNPYLITVVCNFFTVVSQVFSISSTVQSAVQSPDVCSNLYLRWLTAPLRLGNT